jgi:hypothetical protein
MSVYRRYAIVASNDLMEAMQKLQTAAGTIDGLSNASEADKLSA